MAKEYVPIFFDWIENTQDLTAEEKGNLIDAVILYASGQEYEHLLTGGCRIAFRFLKGQVDRNSSISEARAKAGASKKEQTESNENKTEQNTTKSPKEKEKEKEEEKENKKDNVRFTPPTKDEVSAYCLERGNNIDPDYFIAYYANRDWKLSNGRKMKDWKLAIVTWEKNNFSKPSSPQKTVVAQQYEQRDYSRTPDEDKQNLKNVLDIMAHAMSG